MEILWLCASIIVAGSLVATGLASVVRAIDRHTEALRHVGHAYMIKDLRSDRCPGAKWFDSPASRPHDYQEGLR